MTRVLHAIAAMRGYPKMSPSSITRDLAMVAGPLQIPKRLDRENARLKERFHFQCDAIHFHSVSPSSPVQALTPCVTNTFMMQALFSARRFQ